MINNDILRRVRYIFDFGDAKMVKIFGLADAPITREQVTREQVTREPITREQVSNWLKKEDDPDFQSCHDIQLATFLNGLIILKRGKKEGSDNSAPPPEKNLTNNLIFTKLKIALNLKSEDILAIMDLAGFTLSKHELSAFFRKPGHKHHRACHDQVLRNFLQGLQIKHRGKNRDENEGESQGGNNDQPSTAYAWKSISDISQNED